LPHSVRLCRALYRQRRAGAFVFFAGVVRPCRTSWLIVGNVVSLFRRWPGPVPESILTHDERPKAVFLSQSTFPQREAATLRLPQECRAADRGHFEVFRPWRGGPIRRWACQIETLLVPRIYVNRKGGCPGRMNTRDCSRIAVIASLDRSRGVATSNVSFATGGCRRRHSGTFYLKE
jgi:hypothetical protein